MKCESCGYSNTDSSKFCIKCGEELDDTNSEVNSDKIGISEKHHKKIITPEERYKNAVVDIFFKGVGCTLFLPKKDLVLMSHSGTTRAIATIGFGLIGLATTSGIQQKKIDKTMETTFQIVDKGVVFRNANNGKDLRISYENIVRADLTEIEGINYIILTLLENQHLRFRANFWEVNSTYGVKGFRDLAYAVIRYKVLAYINKHAKGMEFEESGWGLPSTKIEENLKDYNKKCDNCGFVNHDSSKFCIKCGSSFNVESDTLSLDTSIEKLEKLTNMYKERLLTDDEFKTMKSKIINED